MQARLKVLHDKANVKQVRLLPVTLIGRSTDCNLKIASSQVSRNHCRITLGDDAVYVEDLGSANGTLVDGQALPAHQPTSISPGAHLVVGPAEFLIDFTGPTSPTMVLPGMNGLMSPSLPSTEVIAPNMARAEQATSEIAQAASPAQATPAEIPYMEGPTGPTASVVTQPPLPVESAFDDATDQAGGEMGFDSAPADVVSAFGEEVAPSAAAEFDAAEIESPSETGAFEETVQFNFQESEPNGATASVVSAAAESEANDRKKPGLKSLFSLFGRKTKSPQSEPTVVTDAAVATAAAVPGVFLPTIDQQVNAESVGHVQPTGESADTANQFAFAPPEAEASADDAAAEEDDGFSQFLQQL
jgi:predicted component of type VI protein secretion system